MTRLSDTRWKIKIGGTTYYVRALTQASLEDDVPGEYVVRGPDDEESDIIKAFSPEAAVRAYLSPSTKPQAVPTGGWYQPVTRRAP